MAKWKIMERNKPAGRGRPGKWELSEDSGKSKKDAIILCERHKILYPGIQVGIRNPKTGEIEIV